MTRYEVKHAYRADRDGDTLGPWQEGDTVELEPEVAEWVTTDSPGALAEAEPAGTSDSEGGQPAARAKPAGRNRQAKGGANR